MAVYVQKRPFGRQMVLFGDRFIYICVPSLPMTKNINTRKFLDEGIIDTIEETQLQAALCNAAKCRLPGAQELLIVQYYTGCRPAEALHLTSRRVRREGHYVIVDIPGGVKGALPRSIYIKDRILPRQLYTYAAGLHPDMFLFHAFRSSYIREGVTKKGKPYTRNETSNKIKKHIEKWFRGVIDGSINAYFLRHNFFSKLAARGVSMQTLRVLKGARNISSVNCYTHLSTKTAKEVSKHIV